ncbi:MAG: PAS domain S-box protein, partial [Bacteroidota bacterium]|nr:PAS domain S-box protein [Bacteroidota bacterium]
RLHREREASLERLNVLQQSVLDSLREALFVLTPELRLRHYNRHAELLISELKESLGNDRLWPMLDNLLSCDARAYAERAQREEKPASWELMDEREQWWELRFFPFPGGMTLYLRDITAAKHGLRRQIDLQREREELLTRLQMHIDRMPIGYIVTDANFRVQYLNPNAERLFGYSGKELQGKKPYGVIIPEEAKDSFEEVREALLRGRMTAHMTSENITRDGRRLTTEWYNTPILNRDGGFESLVSMVVNVTERTRALEELRHSEARYRAILEAQNEWIVRCKVDGTLTFANAHYCRYFDMSTEQMIGRHIFANLPDAERRLGEKVLRSLTKEAPTWEGVLTVTDADGRREWHWWSARALIGGDDRVMEIQAVGRDITDQKRAELALRDSEERYRILIERANDGILLLQDEVFISSNPSAAKMLGMEPEELLGLRPEKISPKYQPDGATSAEKARRLIHESITGDTKVFEWIHLRKDGSEAVIEVSLTRIELQTKPVLLCFWRDITLRKEAERELLLSRSRLRALAERLDRVREEERLNLSREIHDGLGQSLTALKIDLSYLRRIRKQGRGNAKDEDEAMQSMGTLVEQLISQARHLAWEMRPGMLDQLGLADALRQHAHDTTRRNDLQLTDRIEDIAVDLDPRTALALYRIAQEAMTNVLRHARARNMRVALRQSDLHIFLEIADDGVGIPRMDHEQITSMGLISMRERAELLGGSIDVRQGREGGTRVCVSVPIQRSMDENGSDTPEAAGR